MKVLNNSLRQSHFFIKSIVEQGAVVVDATAGNGNDTCFLAELVGETGKVYAFDVQSEAIRRTKEKTVKYAKRIILINDGHENVDKYIDFQIDAAMFNLGYLPGGEHKLQTKPKTTKQAIEKVLKLLKRNGLVTIVIYHGGDSGSEEKEELDKFLANLNVKEYTVMKTEFTNQINCPPILICIEKIC